METRVTIRIVVTVMLLSLVLGIFIGRQTVTVKEVVKYLPGEKIRGEIDTVYLVPKEVSPPRIEKLPPEFIVLRDTIYERDIVEVDTMKILEDYMRERKYSVTLFSSKEEGRVVVNPVIQYNTLTGLSYEHTPVVKEVVTTKKPLFTPFISIGAALDNSVSVGGGMYYHNVGLEYNYQKNLPTMVDTHWIKLNIKM